MDDRLADFARSTLSAGEVKRLRAEVCRLREALVRIQKLTDKLDEDDHAYNDVDELQLFENEVMVIVELALTEPAK